MRGGSGQWKERLWPASVRRAAAEPGGTSPRRRAVVAAVSPSPASVAPLRIEHPRIRRLRCPTCNNFFDWLMEWLPLHCPRCGSARERVTFAVLADARAVLKYPATL
jgi:hypothetical protein